MGFFVGWSDGPSRETHLRILKNSQHVVLAVDDAAKRVVGFVSVISDGILSAHISLLEVLPEYRGKGIGKELLERALGHYRDLYAVDVMCDEGLQEFYARSGMKRATGMMVRNFGRQSGRVDAP